MQSRVVARTVKKALQRDPETKQMFIACECGERCLIYFGITGDNRNLCQCGRMYNNAGWLVAMPPADWREKR